MHLLVNTAIIELYLILRLKQAVELSKKTETRIPEYRALLPPSACEDASNLQT